MLFLKLKPIDYVIGIAVAISVSFTTTVICSVLGQLLTHVYIR